MSSPLTRYQADLQRAEFVERQKNGVPDKEEVDRVLGDMGVHFECRPNHHLASWTYSMIFEALGIDAAIRERLNTFLQEQNFPEENSGSCYRHIYTVHK